MILTFDKLHLENFQSIGEATVNLDNQGIVAVVGKNNYESNASSNGSGKSTLFNALFWALYGKTPEGILDPSNRYTEERCQVSIVFQVDNNNYSITRSMAKSSQLVVLKINDEDQSSRNRTDTDKTIRDSILQMSPEIFLSLVYLSQGFSTRLSLLTPTARKDRLEQLTNTSILIDNFSETISDFKSSVNKDLQLRTNETNQLMGQLKVHNNTIESCTCQLEESKNIVDYYEHAGRRYTKADLSRLSQTLKTMTESIVELNSKTSEVNQKVSSSKESLRTYKIEIQRADSDKIRAQKSLNEIQQDNSCPTCHQVLPVKDKERLESEYVNAIQVSDEIILSTTADVTTIENNLKILEETLIPLLEEIKELNRKKGVLSNIIDNIPDVANIDTASIQQQIEQHTLAQTSLSESLNELELVVNRLDTKLAVVTHCQQLITKQFRTYLLMDSIKFLNERLRHYSEKLFSNDVDTIKISSDSQKLDIYLSNALYDTLSGGERRKVDLALMLAQRDLASQLAGMTCNILILDEILESMDELATQTAINLLEQASASVSSMFIISHNNYALPTDAVITVVKGSDRVSHLELQ